MRILDSVPRPLRLLPVLAAAGLLMYVAGYKPPAWLALVPLAVIAALAALALLRGAARGPGPHVAHGGEVWGLPLPSRPQPVDMGSPHSQVGDYVVYEVEVMGDRDAANRFIEALRERAASGASSYVLVTLLDRGVAAYLIVRGKAWASALVESEIVKSLASAVGGVRLRQVDPARFKGVAQLLDRPSPAGDRPALARIPLHWEAGGQSDGEGVLVRLGERVDAQGGDVVLRLVDVEGHIGVFGSTGTGKSTTAAIIACQLARAGFEVVVLDWTGEYVGKLPCTPSRVVRPVSDPAPVDPVILASSGDVELAVETISRALSLTPPQEYMLATIMERYRPPSLPELINLIAAAEEQAKWDREVKRALLRRLGSLASGRSGQAFNGSLESPFFGEGLTVVRLDEIRTTLARRAYVLFLVTWAYTLRYSGESGRKVVYVIDEAHNVLNHPESGVMESMVAEARKYGLHFIIVTQSPAALPNSVLLNTNTKIIHALRSGRDKDVVAEAAGIPARILSILDKLRRGEAVVVSPSNPEPVLVRIKLGGESASEFNDVVEA